MNANEVVTKDLNADHEQYILKLMKHFADCEMTHLELEIEGLKVNFKKEVKEINHYAPTIQSNVVPMPQQIISTPSMQVENSVNVVEDVRKQDVNHGHSIKAPLVGTYYSSNTPGGKAFVTVGDQVKKGQVLCIIEAMKVMNEIESPYDGVVKQINLTNEEAVGFEQVLMVIE